MDKESCVFCTNAEVKMREIVRNGLAWAFPTNIPIVPGHVLICPIRHVGSFDELAEEELMAMMELRGRLKVAMQKAFGATGFNYAVNEGAVAGQSVPHLHLHMLPRKDGDTGITKYEPRDFLYRPGSREVSPEEELSAVSRLIKDVLREAR